MTLRNPIAWILLTLVAGCSNPAPTPPAGAEPRAHSAAKACLVDQMPKLPQEQPIQYSLQLGGTPLRPGQEFTLAVAGAKPNELTRGIDAYLECWTGEAWSRQYLLLSGRGTDAPLAQAYSPDQAIISIGFDAAVPGRFALPKELKPGWYRVYLEASAAGQRHQVWSLVEVKP